MPGRNEPPSRPSAWPWILTAVLALAVCAAGIRATALRGKLPPGISADDQEAPAPIAVRGTPTAEWKQVEFEAQRGAPGERLDLGARAGVVTLRCEIDPAERWLLAVSALTFCGLAALLVASRPGDPATRRVFRCLVLGGLAIALVGVYPARDVAERALAYGYGAVLAALPVAFLSLALTFPRPSPWLGRVPVVVPVAAVLAAGAALWQGVAWRAYFATPDAATWAATRPPTTATLALLVVGMTAGCVALGDTARRAPSERERGQARWLLGGIAVAATPFVLLRALPRILFGTETAIPAAVDRAVELAAPAAFAIAVARHRMLDIDVVVRRGVLYTVLALVLSVAAAGLVLGVGSALAGGAGSPTAATWFLAGSVSAAVFVPVRRLVAGFVDGTIFRIGAARRDALRSLAVRLADAPDPRTAASELLAFARSTFDPTVAAVVVDGDDEVAVTTDGLEASSATGAHRELASRAPVPRRTLARRDATAVPEIEGDDLPATVPGVALVQPVVVADRLRATLWLGARRGGRHYVEEEVALLADVADGAGPVLERLRLVRAVAREALARDALAELDRRRTDFLLRVAHDLRSPLTAVRWTLDNVLDGLSGPLTPRQTADLSGGRAALRQLGALVENVLTISRMEVGAPPLALERVDLGAAVRDAVAAVEPHATGKGVRIEVATDAPHAVRARRDGLLQIVQNLVDNAVKYAPPGTTVTVGSAREADGRVRLEVRDRGPGLPPGDPARLFERFHTGPSSTTSSSKGLGIGLHVVRSWADSFGATVDAGDAPGGGAVFRVRLHPWEAIA